MTKEQEDNISEICQLGDSIKFIVEMSKSTGMTIEEVAELLAMMAIRMYGRK